MGNVISIILQASGIALTIGAMRWLFAAKGPLVPRTRDDTNLYNIKWQWRAVGVVGGVFWITLSGWVWLDRRSRPDGTLIALTLIFVAIGIWISRGSVTTNQTGVTKKGLMRSRTFTWGEITEIRLHQKQGGAIELRAGSQKLVIDFRVIAFEHLLHEIEDRTHLQSSEVSS
jgi:hypothetical protein